MGVNNNLNLLIRTSKKLDEQGFYRQADKLTFYINENFSNSKIVVSQIKPIDVLKSQLGPVHWEKFVEIVKNSLSPVTRAFVPAKILEEISKYPAINNFVKSIQISASSGYDQSTGVVTLPKTGLQPLVDVGHSIHPVVETFERGEKGLEQVHEAAEKLKNTAVISSIKTTAHKAIETIEKFKQTIVGKGLNVAILIADLSSVIHNADELIEAIHNKEELPIKVAYDLVLRIVRIATNSLLWDIVPGLNVLNKNPQVRTWIAGVNSVAVGLGFAVEMTDLAGTAYGTTNPYNKALKNKFETPGSIQIAELSVPQMKEQYGEVYNALVDVEKGVKPAEAFFKHVPQGDPLFTNKQQLFYATTEKRNQLKQQQTKSKIELYPSATSPYVISSYKKARDAQKKREQEAYDRNFPGDGGGGGRPIMQP